MNNLLRRDLATPSVFPDPLITRVIPRWEIYRIFGYGLLKGIKYGALRRPQRVGKSKRQLYEVMYPFAFISKEHGELTVPRGFFTDFGSVPDFSRAIIDDDDPDLLYGSLPHDMLYHLKGKLADGRVLTRLQADNVLREAMRACGAPELKIAYVYHAVRIANIGAGW